MTSSISTPDGFSMSFDTSGICEDCATVAGLSMTRALMSFKQKIDESEAPTQALREYLTSEGLIYE